MVNAEAVKILEEICLKDGVRLIHISTDYVFNGIYHKPYHEDDIPDPVSVYGLSKLKGESYLKNKGNAMVIRTSWLYSAHGPSFVSKILARASQLNNLRVVSDQIGSPTYAEDLAGAILQIISKSESNKPGFIPGIYHYTNEGVASWFDFAIEILNFFGSGCPVIPVESHEFSTPAPRPFYSVLSKQKIRDTYGLNIPYWKDSLKLCMDEIKITNKI